MSRLSSLILCLVSISTVALLVVEGQDICQPNPCNNGTCVSIKSGTAYDCNCQPGVFGFHCEKEHKDPCMSNICAVGQCKSGPYGSGYKWLYYCDCPENRVGKNCEYVRTPCQPNPCNGQRCISSGNGYQCECNQGSWGTNCESRDFCKSSPCQNGRPCINKESEYYCECGENFIGRNCETVRKDPCQSNPCQNGGTCTSYKGFDVYFCACTTNYYGLSCEIDRRHPCEPNPCKNGGQCFIQYGLPSCSCKNYFNGMFCEHNGDPCLHNLCKGKQCKRLTVENASKKYFDFQCQCDQGRTGKLCQFDKICNANTCEHGICQYEDGHAKCKCNQDYFGDRCEIRDPCASDETNYCRRTQYCRQDSRPPYYYCEGQ